VPGRSCDLVLRGASGEVRALAALPSAELAAAGEDRVVRIYGTWDGALEHELHGHNASVGVLATLDGGVQLVSGDDGGALRIWHVEEGVCLATIKAAHAPGRVVALCELGDGRLASAGSDGLLSLWVRPKEGLREVATRWVAAGAAGQRRLGAATPAGPTAVLRLGTTAHAAAACGDGTLRLFRGGSGEAVAMLLPDDVAETGDESYADVAPALTALALAGGAPPPSDAAPARAACAPRVRDRLWCFAGS
jgi:WD40 repeat protein